MRHLAMRTLAARLLGISLLGVSLASCADLTPLESTVCGNFVKDPGEDCDGHPLEDGTRCAPVDSPHPCRQICDESTVCPTGWGCGFDGVCRQASNTFASLDNSVPLTTPNVMLPADFDGNGVTDILLLGHEDAIGTRPARIAYSEPMTALAEVKYLELHIAAPALGKLDLDGSTLDMAFATLHGVSIVQATATRTTPFASFPYLSVSDGAPFRLVPMDVLPEVAGDEIVMLVERANGHTLVEAFHDGTIMPIFELTYGLNALADNVAWGRFDENAPCARLVFAERGAREFRLISPCRTDGTSGWDTQPMPTSISLPPGITTNENLLVRDFDLDGHIDILVETNGSPHIAWGTGLGTFFGDKMSMTPNMAGPYVMPQGTPDEFPLAAADFNADSTIDFVFPHGLWVSHTDKHVVAYQNFGAPWSSVVVADLNANGLIDVLGGSAENIDCTFLNNVGDGMFNPATLETEGPIQYLASDDFDGDLITDVAVVESYPDASQNADSRVAIGFGKSHGPPEHLVPMGALEHPTQLITASVREVGDGPNATDSIADLFALDRRTIMVDDVSEVVNQAVLFRGDGSRILGTSLPLRAVNDADLPIAMTFTKVFGEDFREITTLGVDRMTGDLRIWTIEGAEADLARFGPFFPKGFHSSVNSDELSFRYGAYMAASDLDGDGTDEVMVVAPFGTSANRAGLVVADYNDDDTFIPRMPQAFGAKLTGDDKFELHDVDGNGVIDAVLSTGTHDKPGELIVLWGIGRDGFDTTTPLRLDPGGGGVTSFACLPAIKGCRLVVADSLGTYSIKSTGDRKLAATRMADLPGASAIATGDFDGDGLVDIALQTSQKLVYYRSIPVNP